MKTPVLLLIVLPMLGFALCVAGAAVLHTATGVWQWGLVGMLPGLVLFTLSFMGALDMGPWKRRH